MEVQEKKNVIIATEIHTGHKVDIQIYQKLNKILEASSI